MSGSPTKRTSLTPMDTWSIQEQLALASAVTKSGENWACVSRIIKAYFDKSRRPLEWFSPKNCARQYSALLDKVEKPKRKRGSTESTVQSIVRILTDERIKELKFLITQGKDQYIQMCKEVAEIESGVHDNNLSEFSDDIKSDSDIESDVSESSASTRLSDTKDPPVDDKSLNLVDKKVTSASEQTDILDPVKESIISVADNNVDISIGEKPGASVSSTPKKSTSGSPNVSPQLKNLVHTAIAGASAEDDRPKNMSPTSAPTLSMLLEMPPRDRGQPLPEIPTLMSSPNKSPIGDKIPDLDSISVPEIKQLDLEDVTITLKTINPHNDVENVKLDISELDVVKLETQQPTIKDTSTENAFPDSLQTVTDIKDETMMPKEVVDSNELVDHHASRTILDIELPDGAVNNESSTMEIQIDDITKEKEVDEVKLPLCESIDQKCKKDEESTEDKNSSPILVGVEAEKSTPDVVKEPVLAEVPSVLEPISSEIQLTEVIPVDDEKKLTPVESKDNSQVTEIEDKPIIVSTSSDSKRSSPIKSVPIPELTAEEEQTIKSLIADMSINVPKSEDSSVDASLSTAKSDKEDAESPANLGEVSNSEKPEIPKVEELKESTEAVSLEPEVQTELVPEKSCEPTTIIPSDIASSPSKPTPSIDAKISSIDQEQDAANVEKAKNHYIGRGKKAFVVTIVENERGEKVELKTADGSSIKVTRNLSKETGLKIEDLPYSKKTVPVVKEKEETPINVITPSKRKRPRNTSGSSSKDSSKTPNAATQSRQSGGKKGSGKGQNKEVKTPHLRSRRGPTPTLPLSKEDPEKEKQEVVSDTNHSVTEGDSDKKVETKPSEEAKESTLSPTKPIEELVVAEISKEKEKEKERVESDDTEDEFSDALSELENINKKNNSDTEDEADESDSSRNVSPKKSTKSRKERLESADMADDDSSNSAHDSITKKRITRRSAKVSPRKSDSKLKNNEEKTPFRHRDRLSLPVKDSKSESKIGRSSKALTRVKHLSEEASLIYGDLETQTGDGFATRMTRARAKTSSSTPTFPSASKNVTPSSEPETSSDTENKARSTRSRTAAAVATTTTSNSVIDQLPPVTMDSNPSSPCSSTTNSTIIDEDKDQRAFRKSIMLVWNRIAAHKFSSLFLKPISEDKAPGYFDKVKRPMDLATIKRNVETGQIRTYRAFERDIFLMFMNAMMFNPIEHEVSKMSKEMEIDVRTILEDHQKMFPESIDGLTAINDRFMRQSSRILFPALESTRLSDSEAEMEEIVEKRKNLSNSDRKRRAGSNELDTPDVKKRKTRTSTANTSTSSRKIKPQVSPDIVSASYDM